MSPEDTRPVLALDLGTTNVKGVLVAPDGGVLAVERRPCRTRSPRPGVSEQDPDDLLEAAEDAVRAVTAGQPAPLCLALCSAMHSLVLVDRDGRPLTAIRTWADERGDAAADRLRASGAWRRLQEATGTPVHASSPLCKIATLREREPQLFDRAALFLSQKELLLRRFCETDVVDESVASASGLYDLGSRDWSRAALEFCGIGAERLARVVPTVHVLDSWRPEAARRLGLPADLPLVVGATDGVLANVGVGADRPGVAAVTMGTSSAARVVVDRPGVRAESGLFCYVLRDGRWVVGGASNNAGNVLDWLGRIFWPEVPDTSERIRTVLAAAEAGAALPGCRVAFDPRLSGERFPDYDARLRGGWSGLSLATRREDLLRAAVDAIVATVAAIVATLAREVGPVHELRGGGGVLRSPWIAQSLADRTGLPLRMPATVEASAVGAARLARAALGASDFEDPPCDTGYLPRT